MKPDNKYVVNISVISKRFCSSSAMKISAKYGAILVPMDVLFMMKNITQLMLVNDCHHKKCKTTEEY